MTSDEELDAQILRDGDGGTYEPDFDVSSEGWSRVILPVLATASHAIDDQLERLNRFSLPLVANPHLDQSQTNAETNPPERANPESTAHRFLDQLRSDFRRVAFPGINLADIDSRRHYSDWETALKKRRIKDRSVAVLAVGQYLADDGSEGPLELYLRPWLQEPADSYSSEWFETTFGLVVGTLVLRSLSGDPAIPRLSEVLAPTGLKVATIRASTAETDDQWYERFVRAGAQELIPIQTVTLPSLSASAIIAELDDRARRIVARELALPTADIDLDQTWLDLAPNSLTAKRVRSQLGNLVGTQISEVAFLTSQLRRIAIQHLINDLLRELGYDTNLLAEEPESGITDPVTLSDFDTDGPNLEA